MLVKVNRHTVERYYTLFRKWIFEEFLNEEKLSGKVKVNEGYFGATRVRGKKGRGARKKIPVVGLLKQNGKAYTKIVVDCTQEELMPVIKGEVLEGSTAYTDGWKSYDVDPLWIQTPKNLSSQKRVCPKKKSCQRH